MKRVALLLGLSLSAPVLAEPGPTIQLYKDPSCGCCEGWADHMRAAGYRVNTEIVADMGRVKRHYGVPAHGQSCHTALVDGYVLEGHVPAHAVNQLLAEQPPVQGLTVPGMPIGSPGMEVPGRADDLYAVVPFKDGKLLGGGQRYQGSRPSER
ncbi:DUF411 domain-containing protein [Isoalcanivorax beigongshangi]|uniref:DUF411 domain-containing protein n=1 Tax=Isoalcanivorax beigongshangi TaxID=3238810 RepID=A0ABV4AEU9_9GAMM